MSARTRRSTLARLGVALSAGVLVGHVMVLCVTGGNAMADPISTLSRGPWSSVHTVGLMLFALAHLALAGAMAGAAPGWLWQTARGLIALAGVGVAGVAVYFAIAPVELLLGDSANDPLSVLACVVGTAMGAAQLGWARSRRWMSWVNALCLAVWLLLVPVILVLSASWLGAYERTVGGTYVIWVAAQSAALATRGD